MAAAALPAHRHDAADATSDGRPAWTPPNDQAKKPATFAIIALVVGIIALLTGLVPVLGLLLGAAGITLGIIALVKKQSKGMAIAALVLSGLAFIASASTTAALGTIASNADSQSAPTAVESSEPSEAAKDTTEAAEEPAVVEEPAAPAPEPEPEEPSVPAEFTSALDQADTYSNLMYMSKAGVYDQLVSEFGGQFTPEAAQYAIDNVESDWNNNALESAKNYQETMSMSPAAIYDQLVSEYGGQFLPSEADYAIAHLNE